MYHKKIHASLIFGAILVLSLLLGLPKQNAMADVSIPIDSDPGDQRQIWNGSQEILNELSEQEFQKEIGELKKPYANFVVLYDLEDPEGIDPQLLPDDIAALVDGNTKIVAYTEAARPDARQVSDLLSMSNPSQQYAPLGTPCVPPDGTRDFKISTVFGEVTQYHRVYALRYDTAPWNPAQPLTGWEFEKQWSKWTRTDNAWYVTEAKMAIESTQTQDFCTGNTLGRLKFSSTWFEPTFYGNTTNWFSVSSFPNNAYIPLPYNALAFTQADIYHDGTLKYNDARTREIFPHTP